MNTWIDYTADFLVSERAKAMFDWINTQSLKPETGRCGEAPTHDSIQWGPRQAYIACVAPGVRIQSSGPIPVRLSKLHAEIEQRYQAHFNSIQVNRHWDENSVVHAHSDLMHGHIVMLSLGAERRFVLRYKHDHKAKNPKWKAGDIYFDQVLSNGSLLTIYKQHQFDLTHEMPKAEHTCGPKVSLIWRYIAEPVTEKLARDSLIAGQSEYREARAKWAGGQKK
jgi:alkylated DNA repair dioxygenase AlkB